MKCSYLILVALLSGSMLACKNNKSGKVVIVNDSATIEKTYSEKGVIIREKIKPHNAAEPVLAKVYYPDGSIEKKYQTFNGQMEGDVYGYFPDGTLMYEGPYRNDLKHGVWIWYYGNKNVEQHVHFKEGKEFGEALFYYSSGDIKIYNFNGKEGLPIYVREYDSIGHLINDEGFPMQIFYNGISYKSPENFEISIMLGLLPDWKAKIVVADISKPNRRIIAELNEQELKQGEYSKVAEITDLIDRPGRYSWEVHAVITDEFGRNIHATDTIPLDVPKSKFKDGT